MRSEILDDNALKERWSLSSVSRLELAVAVDGVVITSRTCHNLHAMFSIRSPCSREVATLLLTRHVVCNEASSVSLPNTANGLPPLDLSAIDGDVPLSAIAPITCSPPIKAGCDGHGSSGSCVSSKISFTSRSCKCRTEDLPRVRHTHHTESLPSIAIPPFQGAWHAAFQNCLRVAH